MHFHVEGLPPFDGEHPLDLSSFTNRELHLIKEQSGVRVQEIEDAFTAGDNDLLVALAMIAVQRNWGRQLTKQEKDRLWDAEVGKVKLVADEEDEEKPEEDDAGPPARPKTGPDVSGSGAAEPPSTGMSSETDGADSQVTPLRATGDPNSGSSPSDQAISAS